MNNNPAFLAARADYMAICAEQAACHKRAISISDKQVAIITTVVTTGVSTDGDVTECETLQTESRQVSDELAVIQKRLDTAIYELVRTSAKASEAP